MFLQTAICRCAKIRASMKLNNAVAIVTGAGSGIGCAIAVRFAAEGALVVVADVDAERAIATSKLLVESGAQSIASTVDVSQSAQVAMMVEGAIDAFGRVDILVNNAGLSRGSDILNIDEQTWDLNLDIVLKSVYLCSKAVLPRMIEQKQGSIVNISSVNGLLGFGEDAYGAAKAGMINLTQNMAVRYGPHGVRVNCIAPGTIRTPAWKERLSRDPNVFTNLSRWYPLRRVGEPEDVANAALFLASAEAEWITGVVLNVDGGLMAGNGLISSELS